jgi:hypothetical protein
LVTEYKDVFRLKLSEDPPAKVKLLEITLREGAEPVLMSAHKYAPPQMKFMCVCYALLRDLCRYHVQTVLLKFLAEKPIMTNLASETIDARYGDCV